MVSNQESHQSIDDLNIDRSDNEDITDDTFELHDEEEDQQMPELDLIEPQLSDSHEENNGTDVDDDDDDDPNGAGELYLDMNDKEFVPKGNPPKNARKSFVINETRIPTLLKKRKSKDRGFH